MKKKTKALIQPEIVKSEAHVTRCLNCGKEFEGNFCPECGQSAETGRYTFKFIWENFIAALIGRDGGIWFTFKNLFTRPGAMMVDMLNGKRKPYFSPFPLLFFTLTVYVLLFTFTGSKGNINEMQLEYNEMQEEYQEMKEEESAHYEEKTQQAINFVNELQRLTGKGLNFYITHYTTVFMLTLPIFLFATRMWYGKINRKRYYRAEYLVVISYSMVMVVLCRCIISLVYLFSTQVSDKMGDLMPFIITAAFTVCFRKMLGFNLTKTIWRSLLAVGLYYVMLVSAIVLIAALGVLYLAFITHKI